MRTRGFAPAVLAVLGLVVLGAAAASSPGTWHTPPDQWKDARVYHTPFDSAFADRIVITRRPPGEAPRVRIFSPNGAYWLGLSPDSSSLRTPRAPEDAGRHVILDRDVPITLFNERDYRTEILLRDHYPNFPIEARWINEKLLYVQVWWGRILGSYLIYDAERESVLIKEMVNDGQILFQQWREGQSR